MKSQPHSCFSFCVFFSFFSTSVKVQIGRLAFVVSSPTLLISLSPNFRLSFSLSRGFWFSFSFCLSWYWFPKKFDCFFVGFFNFFMQQMRKLWNERSHHKASWDNVSRLDRVPDFAGSVIKCEFSFSWLMNDIKHFLYNILIWHGCSNMYIFLRMLT